MGYTWLCGRNGLDLNSEQLSGAYVENNILSTYLDRFGLAEEAANTVEDDPGFVAADDFHLSPGSPCVDTGVGTRAPATDLEDQPRPQGAGYDQGVYER